MLADRYVDQTIAVVNEGVGGEWAEQGAGRFPSVLRTVRPDIVILLEGVNDLNFLGRSGQSRTASFVESMAKEVRFFGAKLLVAGYPPEVQGRSSKADAAAFIQEYNARLREMTRGEGGIYVDLFAAFGNDSGLIGPDGLHPTPAGYDRMAQTFFDIIKANFEEARTTAQSTGTETTSHTPDATETSDEAAVASTSPNSSRAPRASRTPSAAVRQ